MKPETAVDLYKLSVEEEHYWSDKYQRRIQWFIGLLSALIGAVVAGSFKAKTSSDFGVLCVGPVVLAAVAGIGYRNSARIYTRYLEAVTVRAKLEDILDLTKPDTGQESYWAGESIVPQRHMRSRQSTPSSNEWIDMRRTMGNHKNNLLLFGGAQVLAICLLAFIVARLYTLVNGAQPAAQPDRMHLDSPIGMVSMLGYAEVQLMKP